MPSLSARNVAIVEGDNGSKRLDFVLTLDGPATLPVTVRYYFQAVTAMAGRDYDDGAANNYATTIAPGASSVAVSINVSGDLAAEGNETFQLILADITNAAFAGDAPALVATATIIDNDVMPQVGTPGDAGPATAVEGPAPQPGPLPTVGVRSATFTEGDSGTQQQAFLVTLDRPATAPVTIQYYFQSGAASSARGDYDDGAANNYAVTIPAGSRSAVINLAIRGDLTPEGNESFQLVLANVTNGVFAGNAAALVATGTIIDDDNGPATGGIGLAEPGVAVATGPPVPGGAPTVSVFNATFAEGDTGSQQQGFLVTLDRVATAPVTVQYYFQSAGASSARGDYDDGSANNYAITIPAGSRSAVIDLAIRGDLVAEGNEAFQLVLANVTNGVFAGNASALVATGMLIDDDSGAVTGAVGLNGLAAALYGAPAVPGAAPTVSVFNATFAEGDTGSQQQAFLVTLDRPATAPVSIQYYFQSGTASSARGDYDDGSANNYILTIPAGSRSGVIDLPIRGDLIQEGDETFQLVLANVANGVFAGNAPALVATGTIIDDDGPPASGGVGLAGLAVGASTASGPAGGVPIVSVHNATFAEGDGSAQQQAFLVTLDRPATAPVTVQYYVQSGTASAASGDYDDGSANNYVLTIPAGSSSGVINLSIRGDVVVESDETFQLVLANVTNGVFAGGAPALVATGLIVDDDGPVVSGAPRLGGVAPGVETAPSVSPNVATASIHSIGIIEGDSGSQTHQFLVTLDRAGAGDLSFDVNFQSGSATAGSDFTANSGRLTIPAGQRAATIVVTVRGDAALEGSETFQVILSNIVNGAFAGGATTLMATGTILDDDASTPRAETGLRGFTTGGATAPLSGPLEIAFDNILLSNSTNANAQDLAVMIKNAVAAGSLSEIAAVQLIVDAAKASSSVAILAYEFFTGSIPGRGGMEFLVSPDGPNPNNINSDYYQSFNLENRYINFSVNLGKFGEGNGKFTAEYGDIDLFAATKKAYGEIFGATPSDAKIHAILDPQLSVGGQTFTRAEYFAYYGQDGLNGIGTKAAMVGFLLAEAVKAEVGVYAKASEAFLTDAADGAAFGIDLIGVYGRPEYIFMG